MKGRPSSRSNRTGSKCWHPSPCAPSWAGRSLRGSDLPPRGPAGAIPIGLEGDWLDRFGALLGERGRFAERQLAVADNVAAPSDPQRLLDRALDLPNAVWRLHDAKPTWTRCLLLAFRYTAISDEKREGLVWLGFNQGTGAVMDDDFLRRLRTCLASVVRVAGARRRTPAAPRARRGMRQRSRRVIQRLVGASCPARSGAVPQCHAPPARPRPRAGSRLSRRSAADRAAETCRAGSASGEKAEADRRRETMRIAAIEREYAAKLDDLSPQLRFAGDSRLGAGTDTVLPPCSRYEC